MINRLLPEQISNFWNVIKYAIEQSLPPFVTRHSDSMNRILSSLLSGKTSCWASYERGGEGSKFNAIVLTKILYDDTSHTKNLLLYSVYGYTQIEPKFWMEGFAFFSKHAIAQGCDRLVAYTDVPFLIEMAKAYEAEMQTFISFNIKKTVEILRCLENQNR